MPADGIGAQPDAAVLSFEQILTAVRALHGYSPLRKIRLTGGEPLVRKGVVALVAMLAQSLPETQICLTTNGLLLPRHANALADAGLLRVNVSLDTLDPEKYRAITRGGDVTQALAGILAATDAGLNPVRVNCVCQRGLNDDEAEAMVAFALDTGVEMRFLEMMSIGEARHQSRTRYVSTGELLQRLSRRYEMSWESAEGTATTFTARDGARQTRVGFISPVSEPFCSRCDRLRLDSHGRLFTCLMTEDCVELAPLLDGPEGALDGAIHSAVCSHVPRKGEGRRDPMSSIGG
jgi:cyclic pyranopterin phosphate synthase